MNMNRCTLVVALVGSLGCSGLALAHSDLKPEALASNLHLASLSLTTVDLLAHRPLGLATLPLTVGLLHADNPLGLSDELPLLRLSLESPTLPLSNLRLHDLTNPVTLDHLAPLRHLADSSGRAQLERLRGDRGLPLDAVSGYPPGDGLSELVGLAN